MPIQAGNEGIEYKYTFANASGNALDISAATGPKLIFRKPDGTVVTVNAEFDDDGSDGIIKGTLAGVTGGVTAGIWKWQGYLTVWNGAEWYGEVLEFKVEGNLE